MNKKEKTEKIEEYARFARDKPFHQRELARLEEELWQSSTADERKGLPLKGRRETLLVNLLGGNDGEMVTRRLLYTVGHAIDPLWERVEKDYTIRMALGILRRAREQYPDLTLDHAVVESIKEYDSRPFTRVRKDGKIERRRTCGKVARLTRDVESEENKKAIAPKVRNKKYDPDSSATFWIRLRKSVEEFIRPRLQGVPHMVAEQLYVGFETDLKVILDNFRFKISRTVQQEKAGVGLSNTTRKVVLEACRALSIKPPKNGDPAPLDQARKMQRKLAAIYHPDKYNGDESMVSLYSKVMEAYSTLENYNDSLRKTNGDT